MRSERYLRCAASLLIAVPLVLGVLLGGCGGLGPSEARAPDDGTRQGVYAPDMVPFGKTYSEWTAVWWRWLMSIPLATNPARDPDGRWGHIGQSGPVWFLAGTSTGEVTHRELTVPSGKALLLPIITIIAWIPLDGRTCPELVPVAEAIVDRTTELQVLVDGHSVADLSEFRIDSPCFVFEAPEDDPLFPGGGGRHTGYADGYWVMLEPLSPGHHTVRFYAKLVFPGAGPGDPPDVYEIDVAYELTIE